MQVGPSPDPDPNSDPDPTPDPNPDPDSDSASASDVRLVCDVRLALTCHTLSRSTQFSHLAPLTLAHLIYILALTLNLQNPFTLQTYQTLIRHPARCYVWGTARGGRSHAFLQFHVHSQDH